MPFHSTVRRKEGWTHALRALKVIVGLSPVLFLADYVDLQIKKKPLCHNLVFSIIK